MEPQYPSTSKKRLTGFNEKWISDPDFAHWIKKKSEFIAECKICNSDIMIKYEGRRALTVSNRYNIIYKNMVLL